MGVLMDWGGVDWLPILRLVTLVLLLSCAAKPEGALIHFLSEEAPHLEQLPE